MHLPEDAVLLRIFIGESDRYQHQPLYQAIVLKARELELAGATVLRGPMGFGKSSHLHTAKILRLSMDLPTVIEIVDMGNSESGTVDSEGGVRGRDSTKDDVTKVGASAGVGAIIGAIFGGGHGAAIGDAIGGSVGTAGVLTSRGKELRLERGQQLKIRTGNETRIQ